MIWEVERHDWFVLRAMGSASHVPQSIEQLQHAQTSDSASSVYWMIDNVVIVQGQLYEAACPTAACLVVALLNPTAVARPYILELLAQIATGEASDDEVAAGNLDIKAKCLAAIVPGVAAFYFLLQHGTDDEQAWCVDILGSLASHIDSINGTVVWYLGRALTASINPSVATLIGNWIKLLNRSA